MGADDAENMKKRLNKAVTTLVGTDATVSGNLAFDRGCHVGGTVKGDVTAQGNKKSELTVAHTGRIEGNAAAGRMLVQGTVLGDLSCNGTLTLKSTARVEGSIECGQIEIEKGAVVTGRLLTSAGDALPAERTAAPAPADPGPAAPAAEPAPALAPAGLTPDPQPAKPVQPALS